MRRRLAALLVLAGAAGDAAAAAVDPATSMLSEYTNAAAPDPHPPPYTLLRFNERYDQLADPAQRRDWADPAKYIALDAADPARYLSFGGELRLRYERFDNADFGTGDGRPDPAYLLQRIAVHADLHLDRLRLFAQALSALQFGDRDEASPINQNPLDLQQAFVDYRAGDTAPEGRWLIARAGRFGLNLGAGRLVATRAAPNVPYKFDGLQLIAADASARLYGFLLRPAQESRRALDGQNDGRNLWGLYASFPTGWRLPATLDLYYLGTDDERRRYARGSAAEQRHSLGAQLSGSHAGWQYDWEPIVQFGRFGDQDILAWTLATDTGYRFASLPWQPRLGLKADYASGDRRGPGGRLGSFNPLYFKAGYFNDAALIRPTNIADLHPSLQLAPTTALTATLAVDLLWRATTRDGVYGPAGDLLLPAASSGSRQIGTSAEAALNWKAGRHWVWTLSYVHLFASDAVQAAGGRDVDFLGNWASFTW
jgi:hypothetical protein